MDWIIFLKNCNNFGDKFVPQNKKTIDGQQYIKEIGYYGLGKQNMIIIEI